MEIMKKNIRRKLNCEKHGNYENHGSYGNRRIRAVFFALAFAFAFASFVPSAFAQENPKKIDVVFMHDVHSFIDAAPKVKTLIDEKKSRNPEILVLDAGDFSMGTLYQTIFTTHASELRILGKLGVVATTLGNHEFDFGAEGLSKMLVAAKNSEIRGEAVPQMLLCNAKWETDNDYTRAIKEAMDFYGEKDYMMIEKDGVKIAVIGVFGKDALRCAPTCEIAFDEITDAVRRTVDNIKANENADMIVCISHSGTNRNPSKSEDELLAKAVPELDLIISGHTHTVLENPIIQGETTIASCGAYNAYLGTLSLSRKENGRWNLSEYELVDLSDENIPEDAEIKSILASYAPLIDSEYLSQFGLSSRQVIARTEKDIDVHHEVGYLMAEAMFNVAEKAGVPVDFATVPSGVIRGTYKSGDITVSDIFDSYSLGIGPDEISGYPLIAVYLSGKEIKNVCEIDATLSPIEDTVRLFMKGVSYDYNPKRLILDKVTDVYKVLDDGTKEKIDENRLYCAVTDIYTGMMLASVLDMTKGILAVVPKNQDGTVVQDFNEKIIYRENGTELKGWIAIAEGLSEMKEIGDYSDYEAFYVTEKKSANPFRILSSPSKFASIVYVALLVLVLVIAGIIVLCVLLKKRKKNRKIGK